MKQTQWSSDGREKPPSGVRKRSGSLFEHSPDGDLEEAELKDFVKNFKNRRHDASAWVAASRAPSREPAAAVGPLLLFRAGGGTPMGFKIGSTGAPGEAPLFSGTALDDDTLGNCGSLGVRHSDSSEIPEVLWQVGSEQGKTVKERAYVEFTVRHRAQSGGGDTPPPSPPIGTAARGKQRSAGILGTVQCLCRRGAGRCTTWGLGAPPAGWQAYRNGFLCAPCFVGRCCDCSCRQCATMQVDEFKKSFAQEIEDEFGDRTPGGRGLLVLQSTGAAALVLQSTRAAALQ